MVIRWAFRAACCAALCVLSTRAAAVVIDDFSTFQSATQLCTNIGIPVGSSVVGGGILGGERDIRLDITSCVAGDLSVFVTSYFHSADAAVKGTSLAVWDGVDGNGLVINPTGLGGVDLTQGGVHDAIELLLQSVDLNSSVVFEVFTNAGNSSKYTLNLIGGSLNDDYVIPFSSFTTNLGVGADFSNVGAITMLIDGTVVFGLDMILDLLQTTSTLTATKADALFIDNDQDGLVEVGDTIQYTITITNPDDDGNLPTSAVFFTDTPPAGTDLVVGSVTTSQGVVTIGNTGGDTTVAVNVGNIADATSVTITFSVTVNANGPPQVCNQGFVTSGPNLDLPTDDLSTQPSLDPTCTTISYCGDGILDPTDEECDDGNLVDTDACTNACNNAECGDGIVQTGVEECDDGNLVDTDTCTNACNNAECGDGIVQTGVEECDDGNLVDTDTCTNACNNAECGDGIVQTGVEECDDGNLVDTDTCTNACNNAECGDGIVQTGVEECDDGNLVDTDACTNACNNAECGDGIVQTGVEECDDGNLVDTDTCTNACNNAECGDGIVQTGVEECDDGNLVDTDTCTNACNNAECGDGIVQTGVEECDDGNQSNNDGCTNACNNAECGDGFLQPGEQCDDGNTNNNDGCSNTCALPECGDGIVQAPAEQCDDGNIDPGDGCSPTCQEEGCGNNVLDPGEECDGSANAACDGSLCGPNCTCQDGIIPTVSEWGLVMLTLLLLAGAKIAFGRQARTA